MLLQKNNFAFEKWDCAGCSGDETAWGRDFLPTVSIPKDFELSERHFSLFFFFSLWRRRAGVEPFTPFP